MALTAAELVKSDHEHLIHPLHHPVDTAEPMIYVRGRGATLTDIGGKEYIDGLAGLWNVNVGHGRAELAEAAADQIKELAYYSGYAGFSSVPAINLASKLVQLGYSNMQAVFLTCGGAEANESAFKTARFYWKAKGRPTKVKIIARQNAYHGVTLQTMSATGMAAYWKMFEPRMPGFVHIPTCYPYRVQDGKPGETAGQTAARLLEEAILREGAGTVAAFIAEPIHGGGGVIYPTDDYFPLVRQICDRHEVLFIADEVITGFGRTGPLFACEEDDVVPDLMTTAKGLTSGYVPMGAVFMSDHVYNTIADGAGKALVGHGYTYSAHPVSAAVALECLRLYEEGLLDNGRKAGKRLMEGLRSLADHPLVGDVRGRGMLAAVELVTDKERKTPLPQEADPSRRIFDRAWQNGLVIRAFANGVLGYAPPLCCTDEDIDGIIERSRLTLDQTLEDKDVRAAVRG
jgi:putrescine---pyruvate transaminase